MTPERRGESGCAFLRHSTFRPGERLLAHVAHEVPIPHRFGGLSLSNDTLLLF